MKYTAFTRLPVGLEPNFAGMPPMIPLRIARAQTEPSEGGPVRAAETFEDELLLQDPPVRYFPERSPGDDDAQSSSKASSSKCPGSGYESHVPASGFCSTPRRE